jgi:hypothetical protein
MWKFVIPAVAALGLIAGAAQTRATPDAALDGALGWRLSQEGPMAKLAYGVENSDQLALMMTCEPGQTTAVVYGEVQPAGARLTRASWGPTPIDPLSGGLDSESRLSLSDPALRDLARAGRLPVVGDAGRFEIRASVTERRAVRAFLDYCGAGRA